MKLWDYGIDPARAKHLAEIAMSPRCAALRSCKRATSTNITTNRTSRNQPPQGLLPAMFLIERRKITSAIESDGPDAPLSPDTLKPHEGRCTMSETAQEMEAGKKLDARIAREVMGWTGGRFVVEHDSSRSEQRWFDGDKPTKWMRSHEYGYTDTRTMFMPSTDIAAAWQVVEKMRERHLYFQLSAYDHKAEYNAWFGSTAVSADTAPLAICRCALAALAASKEGK